MRKIVAIHPKVKHLLTTEPKYRDSDEKLVARIWNDELREKNLTAYEFFCLYAKNEVTNSDSITRARRKVQQEFPALRGATWQQRQTKETEDTKHELQKL